MNRDNVQGNEATRRSSRANLGKKPERLGAVEWKPRSGRVKGQTQAQVQKPILEKEDAAEGVDEDQGSDSRVSQATVISKSHKSVKSKMTDSSSARLRTRAAELEAMKALLAIDEEILEKQQELARKRKQVIQTQLELEKEQLDDEGSQKLSDDETHYCDSDSVENKKPPSKPPVSSPDDDRVSSWVNDVRPSSPINCKTAPIYPNNSKHENIGQYEVMNGEPILQRQYYARQSIGKDLPNFSGELEEWPAFISQYKNTTELCGFNATENLYRLQKSLKGKAKETVQALLVTPANVQRILEMLESRFGRPELIIETLLKKLKMTVSPRDEQPSTIVDFCVCVQNLVATVENLERQEYLCNPQLLQELVTKLPARIRIEWRLYTHDNRLSIPSLRDFANWLDRIGKAAQLDERIEFACEEDKKSRNNQTENKRGNRRAKDTVLMASSDDIEKPTQKKCLFCNKNNHVTSSCRMLAKEPEEKRWDWVREKKLCFSCLEGDHRSPDCKDKKVCGEQGCKLNHNKLLHKTQKEKQKQSEPVTQQGHVTQPESAMVTSNCDEEKVYLRVAPVVLEGPSGEFATFALFDEASTVTLIDSAVAEKLGLLGKKKSLTMQGVKSLTHEDDSTSVEVKVRGAYENQKFQLTNVRTVANMNLPVHSVNAKKFSHKWKHLKIEWMKNLVNAKPTILIGGDHGTIIVPREVVEGPLNSPYATRCHLGWTVQGKASNCKGIVDTEFSFHVWNPSKDEILHQLVKESFQTETFGVRVSSESPRSKDDIRAIQIMQERTRRVGEKWETGLLWKKDEVILPESKSAALRRLYSMEKKMDSNKTFAESYCKKINEYTEKGYVRKLSPEEAARQTSNTWYLPHFGVMNLNKPGKLRLVFDAAAKSGGVSLNDNLLTGPDMLCPLVGVLFKFRQKKIGFGGDIADMFHRVLVRPEDRHAQRFLWREMDRDRTPDVMEMQVMTFGAACSPTLAQEVKNRNALEFQEEFPEAVQAILKRHYVDDYLDSAHDVESAVKMIKDVREVHRRGDFEIRGWTCSDPEVLRRVSPTVTEKPSESKDINLELDNILERVLGLQWNPTSDTFRFACKFNKIEESLVSGSKRPTKREMLKVVMSVFDPLGFLAPFTVKAKILLQDVWRAGIGWDDELPDVTYIKWKSWLFELKSIRKMSIPRCYSKGIENAKGISLHVFVDASEKAFSAAAYLRVEYEDFCETALVAAKTRVSPLRAMSIPRLELQAAVMGARLAQTIQAEHELKIDDVNFWSDSKTVLCWIRSDSRNYKPFVAHRIGEILETTEVSKWRWVPTAENVSDEATRDSRIFDFSTDTRWLFGPEFMKLPPAQWPLEKNQRLECETDDEKFELKTESVCVTSSRPNSKSVFKEIKDFSSWKKLIRSTAWTFRFINRCLKRDLREARREQLTPKECADAEIFWLKIVQRESFQNDIHRLEKKMPLEASSRLKSLSPKLDENGILRMYGRTAHSPELLDTTKNPVLLDPKHSYTRLLIQEYHNNAGHHGQEKVLNELRQKFWILDMRTAVKSSWNRCQLCKIMRAQPEIPEMGQLPKFRLSKQGRPFTITGLDYFGPMEVTIGRRREKRYGALFTCLSTRAVHIELASSLTTDSAIMAVRRFVARRGAPRAIYSDNGTNFRGADTEIKKSLKEMDQNKLETEMTTKGILWHFIPPGAPNMGGAWERLVRSVKTALKFTLKERAPREEVLLTVLAEAEHTVNCRPLTHVSLDPDDDEALTPNHFLLGSSSGVSQIGTFSKGDLCSRKSWRMSQQLADHFWKRWVKEYLPTLTKRSKWHKTTKPVKVGDLVLIVDEGFQRNCWPRGVISEIYPGKDGVIRVVDVRTASSTYRRPVSKICVLDVEPEEVKDNTSLYGVGDVPESEKLEISLKELNQRERGKRTPRLAGKK